MKNIFICSTPLQLLNILNLCYSELDEHINDIYILDHSHNYQLIYEKALKSKCFDKVELLKAKHFNKHWLQYYKISRYIIKAYEYLNFKKIASKLIKNINQYDRFCVSFMDRSSWLLYLSMKKDNDSLKLIFFEDGTGTYQMLTTKENILDSKLSQWLGFKTVYNSIDTLYVYNPLLVKNTQYQQVKIKKIPRLEDKTLISELSQIYSKKTSNESLLKYRFIFFDSPFNGELIHKQSNMIQTINQWVKSPFCVKLHPSTLLGTEELEGIDVDRNTNIEVLCLTKNVSNNVFISVMSTVCISPELMFGQTPIVIMLYKIIKLDAIKYVGKGYYQFIEDFKDMYSGKFYIPESLQEFKDILDRLDSGVGHD